MKARYEIVYRRFKGKRYTNKQELFTSKEYKKLMKIIGQAIKQNKVVMFDHVYKSDKDNENWYDEIIVEISDG